MRKSLFLRTLIAGVVLLAGSATAGAGVFSGGNCVPEPCAETASCDPCDPCTIFGKRNTGRRSSLWSQIDVYGWVQAGIYVNSRGSTIERYEAENYKGRNVSHFVENSGNGGPLTTVQSTDFQANQVWLGMKKEADGSHGLDWGFAVEGYFGPEGWFGQSWGDAKFDYGWQDGDYHTSIPQLYFQLGYGDWSVKIGKFETVLGYESLRAPDFFFYSHSHMYNLQEPYSHTGAFFEYTPNDKFYLGAAYINGADSSFENKYDDVGFLGIVSYQFTEKLNVCYAVMFNRNGLGDYPNGERRDHSGTDNYFHSLTAGYDITKKLSYGFQWNYSDVRYRGQSDHDYSYGIANYLIYQFNDRWGVGFRTDWLKGTYDGELSEYTIGLNWKPLRNVSIRPEVRYDYYSGKSDKPFNGGRNRDQFSSGVCGVVSF